MTLHHNRSFPGILSRAAGTPIPFSQFVPLRFPVPKRGCPCKGCGR